MVVENPRRHSNHVFSAIKVDDTDQHKSETLLNTPSLRGLRRAGQLVAQSVRKTLRRGTTHKSELQSTMEAPAVLSGVERQALCREQTEGIFNAPSAPDVFVVSPTASSRRSYQVHQGGYSGQETAAGDAGKRIRYSHPTATAVIASLYQEQSNDNLDSLTTNESASSSETRLDTPMTIDLSLEFPGEVNVKQIARQSLLSYEDAKNIVDGLRPKAAATMEYSTVRVEEPSEDHNADIIANREAALAALTGGATIPSHKMSSTPTCLVPGLVQPSSESREDSRAMFFLPEHAHRDSIVTKAGSQPRPMRNTLAYIPYSRFIDRPVTKAGGLKTTRSLKRQSTQSMRHEQVYASVEGLDNFPAFDDSLQRASAARERRHATKSAQLNMVENGYVHFKAERTYSELPQYQKRTIHKEEQEALKIESRQRPRPCSEKRLTFLGRLRASVSK